MKTALLLQIDLNGLGKRTSNKQVEGVHCLTPSITTGQELWTQNPTLEALKEKENLFA